eukprot:g133.t1
MNHGNITGHPNAGAVSDEELEQTVWLFGVFLMLCLALFSAVRASAIGAKLLPRALDAAVERLLPPSAFRPQPCWRSAASNDCDGVRASGRRTCSGALSHVARLALRALGLEWMWRAVAADERNVTRAVGPDAAVLLRLLRMCCLLFGGALPVVLCVLLPVYASGGGDAEAVEAAAAHTQAQAQAHTHTSAGASARGGAHAASGGGGNDAPASAASISLLRHYSLSNVATASSLGGSARWRLWPAVLVAFGLTWWALRLLRAEWRRFDALRREHGGRRLQLGAGGGRGGALRSDAALRAHFEQLFGGKARAGAGAGDPAVVVAHVTRRLPQLEALHAARDEALAAAERALAAYRSAAGGGGGTGRRRRRPSMLDVLDDGPAHTTVFSAARCMCYRVRTVEWRLCELERLNAAVAGAQREASDAVVARAARARGAAARLRGATGAAGAAAA